MQWRLALLATTAAMILGVVGLPATQAQTLDQRISDLRQKTGDEARRQARREAMARAHLMELLGTNIENVDIVAAPLRGVIAWYQDTTHVPVIVNWRALKEAGVDPDEEITVQVQNIPAGQLLGLVMKLAVTDEEQDQLIYEITPWYLRLLTKSQAARHPVMRVYDVQDLVMSIPDFEAPEFGLDKILQQGLKDAGGGGSLFDDIDEKPSENDVRQARGDQLAQLIADTIEPTLWQRNGGEFCSIRYQRGMLIVRAPEFVQRQIGVPSLAMPAGD